jgi:hypothetical protein
MNKKLIVLMTACVMMSSVVCAKMKSVNSRRDFEQNVAHESMVVALFYDYKDKGLTQMYEDVSKVQKFDDADVMFLRVNAARPELNQLAELYGITATAMPTIILFNKGKRLSQAKGRAETVLSGKIARGELEGIINIHFGAEMDKYIANKNAKNSNRLAQEKESWKAYYYPRNTFVNSYGPEERNLE